jgi:hypothetical protein
MKRRSKTSPAPTARYGNSASPYAKKNKKAAKYPFGRTPSDPNGTLHPEYYRSATSDPAGHPDRVQAGVIKALIRDQERAAGAQ